MDEETSVLAGECVAGPDVGRQLGDGYWAHTREKCWQLESSWDLKRFHTENIHDR